MITQKMDDVRNRFVEARDRWVAAYETHGEGSALEMIAYDVYLEALCEYDDMMQELEGIKREIQEMC